MSSVQSERASCCQQVNAASKTLHQQNPSVINWECQVTHIILYDCHKKAVVIGVPVVITFVLVSFPKLACYDSML